jgi:hypothetical protein
MQQREEAEYLGLNFCVWRAALWRSFKGHCEDCILAKIFEFDVGEAGVISMQCNMDLGYQLSFCSRTEENHGKPWSRSFTPMQY